MIVREISSPKDIKKLDMKELAVLASEIRGFLIESISKTGGHLSSNLGIVEITIGLHYVFNSPKDKFIFDVGHQSYVHKILTGRTSGFDSLRQFGGMSGYIKRTESIHDIYEGGHSSTSLSAQSGILKALGASEGRVISVIGDSSFASGMPFEALNYLGDNPNLAPIIILNDNGQSIGKTVGSVSKMLTKIRTNSLYRGLNDTGSRVTPGFFKKVIRRIKRNANPADGYSNTFQDLGFKYFGPIDGNDIAEVISILEYVKNTNKPHVLHFVTKKGKGYSFSETDIRGQYHGVPPFKLDEELAENDDATQLSYSELVANTLFELAKSDKDLNIIVPAMISGSKLERFGETYPDRLIDVGIAEQHATTMAAAMSLYDKNIFLSIYSTFLQRAYDQVIHDIARNNTRVVIGVDRAGIVGEDGDTHQGIFDVAMLSHIPHMKICMGSNAQEIADLINYSFSQNSPIAIRYPRGKIDASNVKYVSNAISDENWTCEIEGKEKAIITYGTYVNKLKYIISKNDLNYSIYNARFIKPIDTICLNEIAKKYKQVIVIEEVIKTSSLYSMIVQYYNEEFDYKINVSSISLGEKFIEHGSYNDVIKSVGLDDESILNLIK